MKCAVIRFLSNPSSIENGHKTELKQLTQCAHVSLKPKCRPSSARRTGRAEYSVHCFEVRPVVWTRRTLGERRRCRRHRQTIAHRTQWPSRNRSGDKRISFWGVESAGKRDNVFDRHLLFLWNGKCFFVPEITIFSISCVRVSFQSIHVLLQLQHPSPSTRRTFQGGKPAVCHRFPQSLANDDPSARWH